jgi:hypothetical protein
MKNPKRIIALVAVVGMLGAAGVVYAATAQTPAEIAAGLTGKSMDDLYKERETGKTFGTIANEAGKLDQFKAQMLEQKKVILDQRVKEGKLTEEQAAQIYSSLQQNQATCDGTGSASIGRKNGVGYGKGMGAGLGRGQGIGLGRGSGKRSCER